MRKMVARRFGTTGKVVQAAWQECGNLEGARREGGRGGGGWSCCPFASEFLILGLRRTPTPRISRLIVSIQVVISLLLIR